MTQGETAAPAPAGDYETLLYEVRGEVALVHLNRPDRLNAWTDRMRGELVAAIERTNADPALGALVLTGSGRAFCAGADIRDTFKARMDGPGGARREASSSAADLVQLLRRSKPLIAAVNGHAIGVGLTMILPFDIILASEKATFQCAFARMGVVTELGSSHFLVQRMGFGRASDLALTARRIDGAEAVALGLADRLVAHERLVDEALETASAIAAHPDRPLRMMKELLSRNGSETDLEAAMARETEYLNECYASAAHKEAVAAFMEKRPPVFVRE